MIPPQADYSSANTQLQQSLLALGRPLPTSKLDLLSGVCWNVIRQCLNRIYLGRWLTSRTGRFLGRNSTDQKESARDAAQVYHTLNQLHLCGESGGQISSKLARPGTYPGSQIDKNRRHLWGVELSIDKILDIDKNHHSSLG